MSVKVHNVFNGRNIVDVHLDIFFNDYSIVHIYVHSLWEFVHQKKFTLLWMFILNGNKNSQKKFKFECSVKTKTCLYIHLCVALLYMANKTCTHSLTIIRKRTNQNILDLKFECLPLSSQLFVKRRLILSKNGHNINPAIFISAYKFIWLSYKGK